MPAKKKAPASKKKKLDWIAFVKKYAKDHKIDYGDAMAKAGPSYRRQ